MAKNDNTKKSYTFNREPLPDVDTNIKNMAYRGMGKTQKNKNRRKLQVDSENIIQEETTVRKIKRRIKNK